MGNVPCSGTPGIKVLLARADARTKVFVVLYTLYCLPISSLDIVHYALIKTHTIGLLGVYIKTNLNSCTLYFSEDILSFRRARSERVAKSSA